LLKQAVFLVGGLGTRLRHLTAATPKPLIRVSGRPFLDYLIDEAARHGFTDVVLLAGHLGEQFDALYDGKRVHGARIRVLREPEPMGTGGAVRRALPELDAAFLLANGDSFFDINLRAMPVPRPGEIAMALRATAPGARYGTVSLEGDLVRDFHAPEAARTGPINAGIYLATREAFATLPEGRSSMEADHFPRLARAGLIRGTVFDGWFIDMGLPDDLARANAEMGVRTRRPAVFFDRDCVLEANVGQAHRSDRMQWRPGAIEAVRACNDCGWFVFMLDDPAGAARGDSGRDIGPLQERMREEFARHGAHVDEFEHGARHPQAGIVADREAFGRRGPDGGVIRELMGRWNVDVARSFLVGSTQSDLDAARAAGIAGHLYRGGDLREFVAARLV